jgi:hypothetical protein
MTSFCAYKALCFENGGGRGEMEWGLMPPLSQYGQWTRKVMYAATLKLPEYIKIADTLRSP